MEAKPSLIFGEWSNWNFESCVGNEGKQRMRKRWCSDGSTIKNPKCCYGKLDFCQTPDKVADIETQICEIQAYWGKWGPWRGNCKNAGTTRQVRGRRCMGGTAGKNQGCKDTIPMRKEVRKCRNKKPKPPTMPTTTKSTTKSTTRPTTTKLRFEKIYAGQINNFELVHFWSKIQISLKNSGTVSLIVTKK